MQIQLVKMAGAYSKPFNISLFWYYIKQIMNFFIRAMVTEYFHSVKDGMFRSTRLSPR